MINFGFTASLAGMRQATAGPAGRGVPQKAGCPDGANAGFFGLLLALFARPLGTDLPALPESVDSAPAAPGSAPADQGLEPTVNVLISRTPAEQAMGCAEPAGQVVCDAGSASDGDSGAAGSAAARPGATNAANTGLGAAEAGAAAGIDGGGLEGILARAAVHRLSTFAGAARPEVDPEPAAKGGGSQATVWPAMESDGGGRHTGPPAPEAGTLGLLHARGGRIGQAAPGATADRPAAFFANEILEASGREEPARGHVLEAFFRMAESGSPSRQVLPGNGSGQVTALSPGQSPVLTEEANGVLLTASRAEEVLASITKMARTRRVEPVVTREDVENAFTFGAPQGAEVAAGRSAPAEDGWAQAAVSKIHNTVMESRAAGKTSARFEITTESGEVLRVRIAMRSNTISARIGVMDSETKEILALHIPELNQRLEMENLIAQRLEIYVMDSEDREGRRGRQRRSGHGDPGAEGQNEKEESGGFSSEPITFEKWA